MGNDNSVSLNKYISSKGLCSRREADTWIERGRLKINGVVAKKGNRVEPGDEVSLDNKPLFKEAPKKVYIALNKPRGIVCTSDKREPDNIIDYINYPERIFHIGRLDKMSEGLILLSNDGDIVNKILRVNNKHEKEYHVVVNKPITKEFIQQMSQGVPILDTITLPCEVTKINRQSFRIILRQGLNRQIRRMCEHLGYHVRGLQRVRIMNLHIGNLGYGKWRHLTKAEVKALNTQTKNSVSAPKKKV